MVNDPGNPLLMKKQYTFVASCAAGLEHLVEEEIAAAAGHDIGGSAGAVTWKGELDSAYRACLWSRFSSRILLRIAEFSASDPEALYEHCSRIEWEDHLDCETTFAVECTRSEDAVITHSKYASLRVKDAIVDYFRRKTGRRPSVKTDRPGIKIDLHLQKTRAFVSIDLSGESLHRRGYRLAAGPAPLKETLAAAIIHLSGWNGGPLIDPMCGSATLLIEAALIFGDSAPGLSRSYFGFTDWLGHNRVLWDCLVSEAVAREETAWQKQWPPLLGYDADPVVVAAAQKNIARAGLEEKIQVAPADLALLQRPTPTGLVVCNPPYGQRLGDEEEVGLLYRALGHILRERFAGWRTGILVANPGLADQFGLSWEASHKLFNGPLSCRLLVGPLSSQPAVRSSSYFRFASAPIQQEGADFANRLLKNLKKLKRWADSEGVFCFRVYDRDIPEYNVSVDVYGKWLYVQEYSPPSTVDTEAAKQRLKVILTVVREIFGVRRDRVFVRTRSRQKGKSQYQKKTSQGKLFEVREGDCRFLVNLSDYIDTGLFLDHRPLRARIVKESAGKRFLNLFGYTGAASVFAAWGGAAGTTTVDLSATYLHWTRLNLVLNGFSASHNETVKTDCLEWLRSTKTKFDLIFLDPPTFSNTKKAGRVFDIQRDHEELLRLSMSRLAEGGVLLFSTNFRKFRLNPELSDEFDINEISRSTIPPDFARNSRVHQCWELRHRTVP